MREKSGQKEHGAVLLMALAVLFLLVPLVGTFLFAVGTTLLTGGWEENDNQVLWLAEAGLQKAIWNLKTPASGGGQGENWTTAGTTESLSGGSYTMAVTRYDFALTANGAAASATSSSSGNPAADAINGNDSDYWESNAQPSKSSPQDLIITFPYTLTLNKVRFLAPSSSTQPRDFSWAVSADGAIYTTLLSITSNNATDRTDLFSVAANPAAAAARYLRLRTTLDGQNNPKRVRISTLETIGSKITSTGTITAGGNPYTRVISQSVVADDASPQSQVAYSQSDWVEQ